MEPKSKSNEHDADETIMSIQRTVHNLTKCLEATDKAIHENELEFLQLVNMAKEGGTEAPRIVRREELAERSDDFAAINSKSVDLAVDGVRLTLKNEEEEFDSD